MVYGQRRAAGAFIYGARESVNVSGAQGGVAQVSSCSRN
jgi:hypothetical protein